jgi:hypothetical protein
MNVRKNGKVKNVISEDLKVESPKYEVILVTNLLILNYINLIEITNKMRPYSRIYYSNDF